MPCEFQRPNKETGIARVIYFIRSFPRPLVRMASELNNDYISNGSDEENAIHPPESAQESSQPWMEKKTIQLSIQHYQQTQGENEVHHHKETGFEEILVISRFDRDARPGETITFHTKLLFYMQCLNHTLIKM